MSAAKKLLSVEEFLDHLRDKHNSEKFELVDGVPVATSPPSFSQGWAKGNFFGYFREIGLSKRGKLTTTGETGWMFIDEAAVQYSQTSYFIHDIAGWKRENHPTFQPTEVPQSIQPDWVLEILSPSNSRNDLHIKWQILQQAQVPYYWIYDPTAHVLLVMVCDKKGSFSVNGIYGQGYVGPLAPFVGVEFSLDDMCGK